MKKLVFVLVAMATLPAAANYYKTETNNCDPRVMHQTLDNAVRAHKAVITEVTCDRVRVVKQPVYGPIYATTMNYDYIPVVDCVPGPTRAEYCGGCF